MKLSERLKLIGLVAALALSTSSCERQSKEIAPPTKPGPASGNKPPGSTGGGNTGRPPGSNPATPGASDSDPAGAGGGGGAGAGGGGGSTGGGASAGGASAGGASAGGGGAGGGVTGGQNGSTNVNIQTIIDDGTGQTIQWDGRTNQGNERWDVIPVN